MRSFWHLASLFAGLPVFAGAESLDATFVGAGRALLYNPVVGFEAVAALPMPSGEIIQVVEVFSSVNCPDATCVGLVRRNSAGSAISTRVRPGGLSSVDAAAVDGSGRVIVVGGKAGGTSGSDVAVLRFNADLSDDTDFSGDGLASYDYAGLNDYPKAVAIDRWDNIVIVGSTFLSATDSDFLVMRLRPNAGPDTTFNGSGFARLSFDLGSPPLDQANAVAIDNEGRILIGGVALDSTIGRLRVAMARLLPTGPYDVTFCPGGCSTNAGYNTLFNGRTIYYFGSNTGHADELNGIEALGNGGFVIAGATFANDGSNRRGAIARFLPDGSFTAEGIEGGLGGNAAFSSVRSADAAGTRLIVAGNSGPGNVFFLLQAFNSSLVPLANYGVGNCMTGNSGFCFNSSNEFGDIGPDKAAALTLDAAGQPLFSGDGIANAGETRNTVIAARFTNTSGPKPDRIFRSGFN